MISFTSKPVRIPYTGPIRYKLTPTGDFVEEAPRQPVSCSKRFLLSPDLEAFARRETEEIDPKYGLGWVLLARIARKMHDEGRLPDPLDEIMTRRSSIPPQPPTAPRPDKRKSVSRWRRLLITVGVLKD